MDQTIMAIQTKFTIATFIGDEKMFREAVDAYKKMDINTETEIKQKHSLTPLSCFPNQPGISRAIFSQLFQEFGHERLLHSGSS
ncbi:Kil protein of bacteriphage BP-933W [Escherichia coli]|uniref:Kil protein of bacteriphage BP-933W n=1 Tax=Escherichia coli TaxID=562 RepID=A0A2X3KEC1_ECOLX|nr:Kil protein of bacteriphage BP-933W [Escherichia coli]